MIRRFANTATEKAFLTGKSQGPPAAALRRKFVVLDSATVLGDLARVPGNNFEKYLDHRKGQYSIRVNKQYRLFFTWKDGNAYDIRLGDEH